jgi:hypothetical protein
MTALTASFRAAEAATRLASAVLRYRIGNAGGGCDAPES